MKLHSLLLASAAAAAFTLAGPAAPAAHAQVSVGVNIGAAPACPYGYYGWAPYRCAPYGYYGPEWFTSGVFIGAGPWYHGHDRFYGHVDPRFDERGGYHGPYPNAGERFDNHHDFHDFHGGEMRGVHGEAYAEHGHDDHHH